MATVIKKVTILLDKYKAVSPVFIRIITGFHLIYVTRHAAFSKTAMQGVIEFFTTENIPIPPLLAPLAVYTEFICGLLFIVGLFTRAAAAIMVFVFICALGIVHTGDSYTHAFPALVMLAGSLSLFFSGSGDLSFDVSIKRKMKSKLQAAKQG